MESQKIYVNTKFLLLVCTLIWHISSFGQSFSTPDMARMPFFMRGLYVIDKITITPKLNNWEDKIIGTDFQLEDTTQLDKYLKAEYSINELPTIYVNDTSIYYFAKSQIQYKIKDLLGFDKGNIMPYTVRHSQKNLGYMSFKVPIMLSSSIPFITGYLTFPEMQLMIEGDFQLQKNSLDNKEYHIALYSHMSHRIDFDNQTKYIPIKGISANK